MGTATQRTAHTAEIDHRAGTIALRIVIVALALGTAYIHATLGGLLCTLNAIGYAAFVVALLMPGPMTRIRWLVRLALIGFTFATIVAWLAFGARFGLAYLDKAIELGLVVALLVDLWRSDGGAAGIAMRIRQGIQTVSPGAR
jgi:hypothetical protein